MKNKTLSWIVQNYKKLLVLIFMHIILSAAFNSPYINIIQIYISFIPYLVDWIFILIVFKLDKEYIPSLALTLFVLAYAFQLLNKIDIQEKTGEIIFILLTTYIVLSLPKLKLSR